METSARFSVSVGKMGAGRLCNADIQVDVVQFHTIPREQFPIVTAVNRCQRVETEDAGDNSLGLDIRQAAGRNGKFLACQPSRNLKTGALNIAHRAPERFPRSTKFVSSTEFHRAHPFVSPFDKCNKERRFFLFSEIEGKKIVCSYSGTVADPPFGMRRNFGFRAERFGSPGSVLDLERPVRIL